jgi:hypothetical protein
MRDCGKPAVCHNGMFDVAYVLAAFASGPAGLPATWTEYRRLVATWFPGGLYDTKLLAKKLPATVLPGGTMLGDVYSCLTEEGTASPPNPLACHSQVCAVRLVLACSMTIAKGGDSGPCVALHLICQVANQGLQRKQCLRQRRLR